MREYCPIKKIGSAKLNHWKNARHSSGCEEKVCKTDENIVKTIKRNITMADVLFCVIESFKKVENENAALPL